MWGESANKPVRLWLTVHHLYHLSVQSQKLWSVLTEQCKEFVSLCTKRGGTIKEAVNASSGQSHIHALCEKLTVTSFAIPPDTPCDVNPA